MVVVGQTAPPLIGVGVPIGGGADWGEGPWADWRGAGQGLQEVGWPSPLLIGWG